jgi:hypothetical protein
VENFLGGSQTLIINTLNMAFEDICHLDVAFTGSSDGKTFWGQIRYLGSIFMNFSKNMLELR